MCGAQWHIHSRNFGFWSFYLRVGSEVGFLWYKLALDQLPNYEYHDKSSDTSHSNQSLVRKSYALIIVRHILQSACSWLRHENWFRGLLWTTDGSVINNNIARNSERGINPLEDFYWQIIMYRKGLQRWCIFWVIPIVRKVLFGRKSWTVHFITKFELQLPNHTTFAANAHMHIAVVAATFACTTILGKKQGEDSDCEKTRKFYQGLKSSIIDSKTGFFDSTRSHLSHEQSLWVNKKFFQSLIKSVIQIFSSHCPQLEKNLYYKTLFVMDFIQFSTTASFPVKHAQLACHSTTSKANIAWCDSLQQIDTVFPHTSFLFAIPSEAVHIEGKNKIQQYYMDFGHAKQNAHT